MERVTRHTKVFLSYRSTDRAVIEEFAARLRRDGVDAWYDRWEITPGDDIVARMDQGIDGCTAGLSLGSPGPAAFTGLRQQVGSVLLPGAVGRAVEELLAGLDAVTVADVHIEASPALVSLAV
ncbi:MAG: toll/interleukin-1 receptor domain-containing protein [Pseudonocardiaceae bacterium]